MIKLDIREENNKQIKTMYDNLRQMGQLRAWSLEKLSEISGINKKILTAIENGKEFDVQYLLKLCSIYQIEPCEIFFE